MVLASTTVTVHGIGGVFIVIAALLFLIAAIVAWFVTPRAQWATLVAAGLFFFVITALISS